MAQTLTTAIAVPFALTGTVQAIVTDSGAGSPRTATFDVATYRQFLAYTDRTATAGTEADPHEWGKSLQHELNNGSPGVGLWTVTLTTDCRWKVAYSGTGTGAVQWDGAGGTSLIPRILTGFTANLSVPAGTDTTATHQPSHFAASISRANDSGRTTLPAKTVGAEMPDGSVYTWSDNRHRTFRSFDLEWHPKDSATKTAQSAAGTPAYPTALSKEAQPSRTPSASYVLPWSLYETVKTAHGVRCGFAFGNLQELIAGSQTAFEDGYFALDTLNGRGALRPTVANWSAYWTWQGITVLTRAQGTR